MKIIIDECVPHIVKKLLPEREIKAVQEMGWAGTKNGELLDLVEADFEVFITSDKNLFFPTEHQRPPTRLPAFTEQSGADRREFDSPNR